MRVKGRHWLLLWLALFLVVALVVTARGASAYRISNDLRKLREQRASLEARRADLERRLRQASSRQVLTDRALRAGLRQPSDSEYILLRWPPRASEESR